MEREEPQTPDRTEKSVIEEKKNEDQQDTQKKVGQGLRVEGRPASKISEL